jgi:NADH-quinone oxidoreductase subunit H
MDTVLVVSMLAKIVFALVIVLTFSPVLVWADRRQSAMIQDRVGPNRAGIPIAGHNVALAGLLHPLADALKFMWKEDFIPPKADKLLHALAPIISVIPTIAAFAVIPWGDTIWLDHLWEVLPSEPTGRGIPFQIASLNVGVLYIFAVGGTGVIGAAIAGYCSDNKYALLGGLRAAGQMVSYEVTLGLSLVPCFMMYNSLLLENMVEYQVLRHWGIFHPWLWPSFILFYAGSIAETKRIPFDIPEGESELAAGYFTEYSGMKFGMFMMGEYIAMVVSCAILVCMFFGGYDLAIRIPVPGPHPGIDLFTVAHGGILGYPLDYPFLPQFIREGYLPLPHIAVVAIGALVFLVKTTILLWLTLMIRWSLPRFRYDQVMKMCWRYMLPASLAAIFVTGIVILTFYPS